MIELIGVVRVQLYKFSYYIAIVSCRAPMARNRASRQQRSLTRRRLQGINLTWRTTAKIAGSIPSPLELDRPYLETATNPFLSTLFLFTTLAIATAGSIRATPEAPWNQG